MSSCTAIELISTDEYSNNIIEIKDDSLDSFECCICLDNNNNDSIKLNCCKIQIHKYCFIEWIIHNGNNDIKCPMCRVLIINLEEVLPKYDFLNYINNIYDTDNIPLYKLYNIQHILQKYENEISRFENIEYNTIFVFYKRIYDNVLQYNILKFVFLLVILVLFIFTIIITFLK